MALDFDAQFNLHAKALSVANQRLALLANNVANADTPNFKARDLDFSTAMREADGGALPMAATSSRHIAPQGDPNAQVQALYRVPEQPSLDGNTVDPQKENAAIAETAVRYQATLTFLSSRIRGIRDALTGGR
jgi:flagellar basal-body rod protein FlgB